MILVDSEAKIDADGEVPEPIYDSVVRSLYGDQKTLLVGSLSVLIAPIILFHRTGDPIQLLFGVLLTLLASLRLVDGWLYHRSATQPLTGESIGHWETRYAILGAAFVGVLGIWCLATMAVTSDEFSHLMSIVITISYLVGIIGRNFSSEKVVLGQTVFTGLPMVSGFVLFGDGYHFLLGLFLLPFFFTIWLMSRNLRVMLFNAVINALANKTIADRFDVALSNVSHGMAMLNREGSFVVVNSRFNALAGLDADFDLRERDLQALSRSAAAAIETGGRRRDLSAMLADCLERGRRTDFKIDHPDGRIVEVVEPDHPSVVFSSTLAM